MTVPTFTQSYSKQVKVDKQSMQHRDFFQIWYDSTMSYLKQAEMGILQNKLIPFYDEDGTFNRKHFLSYCFHIFNFKLRSVGKTEDGKPKFYVDVSYSFREDDNDVYFIFKKDKLIFWDEEDASLIFEYNGSIYHFEFENFTKGVFLW